MTTAEKIYTGLCVAFASLVILGNLTYQKFVTLEIPLLQPLEISVGALPYPLTFIITDLITEFYGKEKATFCVQFTILINIIIVILLGFMDYLPASAWSKIDDTTFHQIFGFFSIAFMGSMIAGYTSRIVNIYLYIQIRKLTKGKYLWLRNNGSTCISLFIDTFIVISLLTLFKVLPLTQMWTVIYGSYLWKLLFTIGSTPFFYFAVRVIQKVLKK